MADWNDMTAQNDEGALNISGAASCPSCDTLCEFELPVSDGQFDIACYECEAVFEIDAQSAIAMALENELDIPASDEQDYTEIGDTPISEENAEEALLDTSDETTSITCIECGGDIIVATEQLEDEDFIPNCPTCQPETVEDDIDFDAPTRFSHLPPSASTSSGQSRSGILLVSIISVALVLSTALIALGLYFLTLRTDSDLTRYIERNILQLSPAKFDVQSASYEISETDLGKSLLVTITLSNSGQVEGAPEEMQIVLTDAQNQALVTWPLDTGGQIIAPGQSTKLYTRLFEPPEGFANLRVLVR